MFDIPSLHLPDGYYVHVHSCIQLQPRPQTTPSFSMLYAEEARGPGIQNHVHNV